MQSSPSQKMAHLSYVGPLVVALLFAQFRAPILDVFLSPTQSFTKGKIALALIVVLMVVSLASSIFILWRDDKSLKKPALWGVAAFVAVASYLGGIILAA